MASLPPPSLLLVDWARDVDARAGEKVAWRPGGRRSGGEDGLLPQVEGAVEEGGGSSSWPWSVVVDCGTPCNLPHRAPDLHLCRVQHRPVEAPSAPTSTFSPSHVSTLSERATTSSMPPPETDLTLATTSYGARTPAAIGAAGSHSCGEWSEGVGNVMARKGGGLAAVEAEVGAGEEKGEESWRLARDLEIRPSAGGRAGSRAVTDRGGGCTLSKIAQ